MEKDQLEKPVRPWPSAPPSSFYYLKVVSINAQVSVSFAISPARMQVTFIAVTSEFTHGLKLTKGLQSILSVLLPSQSGSNNYTFQNILRAYLSQSSCCQWSW